MRGSRKEPTAKLSWPKDIIYFLNMYWKLPASEAQMKAGTGKRGCLGQMGSVFWEPCEASFGVAELCSMQHPEDAESLDASNVLMQPASSSGSKVLAYFLHIFQPIMQVKCTFVFILNGPTCSIRPGHTPPLNLGCNTVQHLGNGIPNCYNNSERKRKHRYNGCGWVDEQDWETELKPHFLLIWHNSELFHWIPWFWNDVYETIVVDSSIWMISYRDYFVTSKVQFVINTFPVLKSYLRNLKSAVYWCISAIKVHSSAKKSEQLKALSALTIALACMFSHHPHCLRRRDPPQCITILPYPPLPLLPLQRLSLSLSNRKTSVFCCPLFSNPHPSGQPLRIIDTDHCKSGPRYLLPVRPLITVKQQNPLLLLTTVGRKREVRQKSYQ